MHWRVLELGRILSRVKTLSPQRIRRNMKKKVVVNARGSGMGLCCGPTSEHFGSGHNFCRVHQTFRLTPAMEAGLTDHVWTLEELVTLLGRKSNKIAA